MSSKNLSWCTETAGDSMTFAGGMDLETFMASGFARLATTAGIPGTEGLLLGAGTMAGEAGVASAAGAFRVAVATMAMAGVLGVAGVAGVVVAALAAGASAPGEARICGIPPPEL